jgi:uncharacterized protein (DUF2147 family)
MNDSEPVRGYGLHAGRLIALALALGAAAVANAQGPTPSARSASAPAQPAALDVLVGSWVRPDGGYVIAIKSVGSGGDLQAMYFNPSPLPFAQAQAAREGGVLRVQFELRAGGYNGSTYKLRYEPATDRLVGIYYQAVAQQSFEVQFVRK